MTGQMTTSPNFLPKSQPIASNPIVAQDTTMVQNSGIIPTSKMNVPGNTMTHMVAAMSGRTIELTQIIWPSLPDYRARMLAKQ